MNINLGDTVEDLVSGYKGIAIMKAKWLFGCIRYGLTADGMESAEDKVWVDEDQLKVIKKSKLTCGYKASEFDLGDQVKDLVSGVKGVVTCITYAIGQSEAVLSVWPKVTKVKKGEKLIQSEFFLGAPGRFELTKKKMIASHWGEKPPVEKESSGPQGPRDDPRLFRGIRNSR